MSTEKIINTLRSTNIYAAHVAHKSDLKKELDTLDTLIEKWDVDEIKKARYAVNTAINNLHQQIPDSGAIRHDTVQVYNNLNNLAAEAISSQTIKNKNTIYNALKSINGLTFTLEIGTQVITFKNVRIPTADRNAIVFNRDLGGYCLDLYNLMDYVDVDNYTDTEVDPGELHLKDLHYLATATNTAIINNKWLMPITSSYIKYKNITLDKTLLKTPTALQKEFKETYINLETLKHNSDLSELDLTSWPGDASIKDLLNLLETIINAGDTLLLADYASDKYYKIIFLETTGSNLAAFERASKSCKTLLTDYLKNYGAFEETSIRRSYVRKAYKNYTIPKAITPKEKKAKKEFDTQLCIHLDDIVDQNWYAIGWLAKHTKRLAFSCPAEDIEIWKNTLNDDNVVNKKPEGFIDAWNWSEHVSGSLELDTDATTNSIVEAYLEDLIQIVNDLKPLGTALNQTKSIQDSPKKINSWLIVRDLVKKYDFQLSPVKQNIDDNGKLHTHTSTSKQDVSLIRPTEPNALKSFNEGYNA